MALHPCIRGGNRDFLGLPDFFKQTDRKRREFRKGNVLRQIASLKTPGYQAVGVGGIDGFAGPAGSCLEIQLTGRPDLPRSVVAVSPPALEALTVRVQGKHNLPGIIGREIGWSFIPVSPEHAVFNGSVQTAAVPFGIIAGHAAAGLNKGKGFIVGCIGACPGTVSRQVLQKVPVKIVSGGILDGTV